MGYKMVDVRFVSEALAQYKVYSLCCHALLNFYEDLSQVCNIGTLVSEFDTELRNSYCGDKYDLAVENVDLFLQRLINRYSSNKDAREKLSAIHKAILDNAPDWDYRPALVELRDTGKGLAQDFYREGGRATNIGLMNSKAPALVCSNSCLSENSLSGFNEPRPISTLPDGIHLPFTEDFRFCYYLSYPFLFFHEYVSHVYIPRVDSRRFEDGWLMYAIEIFMKNRWPELCERYPLISAQGNVLLEIWLPRFTRCAKKGYRIARNVDRWLGGVGVYQPDVFSSYETGLSQLLNQMGREHPLYSEALVYQQRLIENITWSRRYGDTDTRKAERAEMIDQLNVFALSARGVSFSELCGLNTSAMRQAPSERLLRGNDYRFLQITWDLASYPADVMGTLSFHDDFLDLIKRSTQSDTGPILRSAAESSANALRLYENLKVELDKL